MSNWHDAISPEHCPERDGLYRIRLADGTEKTEFYSAFCGWATDEEVVQWGHCPNSHTASQEER